MTEFNQIDFSLFCEDDYKKFSENLIESSYPILGVRLNTIRKLAKSTKFNQQILAIKPTSHEQIMLIGFIIASNKCDDDEFLGQIDAFLQFVDNWATCDTFCASLKRIKNIKEKALNYFINYAHQDDEYKRRFLAVLLMNYYLDSHLDQAIQILSGLNNGKYYTDMAVAWAFATALSKDFSVLETILSHPNITKWVKLKTIQKAIESFRITSAQKQILKEHRAKLKS